MFNGILRAMVILDGLSGSMEYIAFLIDNIVGLPYPTALAMSTTIPGSKNGPSSFRRWCSLQVTAGESTRLCGATGDSGGSTEGGGRREGY